MIILVLILATFLDFINLNQSLWLDEAISALTVRNSSFLGILTNFILTDVHPPLYYLVLKLWSDVFGDAEIILRMPSIIFGIVTVYFVYRIGARLVNRYTGLLAAFLLAINPLFVYYSQEVRMYTLAAAMVSAAIYFFLAHRRWLFILALAAALYTDYVPWLILPVFLFLAKNRRSALIDLGVVGLLLLPWLPILRGQFISGANFSKISPEWGNVVGGLTLKAILLVPVKFIFGRVSVENKMVYAVVVAVVTSLYGFILFRARGRVLWLWLLVPVVLAALVSIVVPIFSYHRFVFVLPALALLLALGLRNYRLAGVLIAVVSLLSLTYFNMSPRFFREDWRSAVRYIKSDPGVILIPSIAQAAPMTYYDGSLAIQDRRTVSIGGFKTVYLVRYVQELFDPGEVLRRDAENAGLTKAEEKSFNGVLVWKYVR